MAAAESGADKQDVRSELLQDRRMRDETAIAQARAAVRRAVLDRCDGSGWRCVAGYEPLRTEPGSLELLDALRERGIRVLVPITLDDRDLDWTDYGTEYGADGTGLGIEAIAAADAVLVPALAVALDGTRLGRGGGSYDRALGRVRSGVPIAALLFSGEVRAELPADPWDRPVTAVVTPEGWRDLV